MLLYYTVFAGPATPEILSGILDFIVSLKQSIETSKLNIQL